MVLLAHEIGADMMNVRRFFLTVLGCVCVAMLLGGAGEPTAGGEAAPLHRLKVERDGQPPREVEGQFDTVRVVSQYGQLELDLAKCHSISIDRIEGGQVFGTVEMIDHTRMSVELLTVKYPIRDGAVAEILQPEPNLKISFLHPTQVGLLAVLIGLLTLTVMEIVLGIDNVIFLAIVAGKLPEAQQPFARRLGLGVALGTRILLLFSLTWLMGATKPLFTLPELPFLQASEARGVSLRDLVLILGGLFLVAKSTKEIHEKIYHTHTGPDAAKKVAKFAVVIVEIALIDIIFSLDSVITAVGMVKELWVMIAAMVMASIVMVIFAEPISRFVEKNPSIKILALSFLILIGVLLLAEGFGQHIDKGYIYFAMAFAVIIEITNMRLQRKTPPA